MPSSCSPQRPRPTTQARHCSTTRPFADPETGLYNALALRQAIDGGGSPRRRTLETFALRDPDGLLDPGLLGEELGGRHLGRVLAACATRVRATPFRLSQSVFALSTPDGVPSGAVAGVVREGLAKADIPLTPTPWVRLSVPEDAATGSEAIDIAVSRLRARAAWDPTGPSRQIRDLVLRMVELRGDQRARTRWSSLAGQALGVGRLLELDASELDILVRAAELRDVGALALGAEPGSRVLLEAGAVARAASDVLAAAPSMVPVARVLRACEERFDGTGAPDGLAGEEIPIQARIIAPCLALEQALEGTPFRVGLSPEDALGDVVRRAGTDFDPEVVRALEVVNAAAPGSLQVLA